MDMSSLHNKVARRIALRGTFPKLLLGFGLMAALLFALNYFPNATRESGATNTTLHASTTPAVQENAAVAGQGAQSSEAAPAKRPFPKADAKKDGATSTTSSPLQALLIGLVMLAGLVAALFFAARFMKKARLLPAKRNERLQLEDVLSLGPKKSLHVVRFENRTLVLASAETGVQLIADYAAEELASSHAPAAVAESTESGAVLAPVAEESAELPSTKSTPAPRPVVRPSARQTGTATEDLRGAERVPAAFRHLLRREQGLELEA
jgi:flagellar biogenesis protein FliO